MQNLLLSCKCRKGTSSDRYSCPLCALPGYISLFVGKGDTGNGGHVAISAGQTTDKATGGYVAVTTGYSSKTSSGPYR